MIEHVLSLYGYEHMAVYLTAYLTFFYLHIPFFLFCSIINFNDDSSSDEESTNRPSKTERRQQIDDFSSTHVNKVGTLGWSIL